MRRPLNRSGLFPILTILIVLLGACAPLSPSITNNLTATATSTALKEPNWGTRSKTTGCKVQGPIQDLACTPGDIFPNVTSQQICVPGYASSVRNVSTSTKNKVYKAYGIKRRRPGQYEVDHLVSLQLGGSNDVSNLWPEAASPKPGFHEKDRVENYLHDQVCNGKMTLKTAQVAIATNWLQVYKILPKNSTKEDDTDSTY
jgi:hypothetical protein